MSPFTYRSPIGTTHDGPTPHESHLIPMLEAAIGSLMSSATPITAIQTEPELADPRSSRTHFEPLWRITHWSLTGDHTTMSGALYVNPNKLSSHWFRRIPLSQVRASLSRDPDSSRRGSRPLLQARLDRREARDSAERSAPSSS